MAESHASVADAERLVEPLAEAPRSPVDGKLYWGRFASGDRAEVFVHHPGGLVVELQHHRKHSPAGFSWGYCGSGPADLARSLIIDHVGRSAWCTACGGKGYLEPAALVPPWITDPDGCWLCLGEGTAFPPRVYQSFKFDVVSSWGDTWTYAAAELDAYLDRFRVDDGAGGRSFYWLAELEP